MGSATRTARARRARSGGGAAGRASAISGPSDPLVRGAPDRYSARPRNFAHNSARRCAGAPDPRRRRRNQRWTLPGELEGGESRGRWSIETRSSNAVINRNGLRNPGRQPAGSLGAPSRRRDRILRFDRVLEIRVCGVCACTRARARTGPGLPPSRPAANSHPVASPKLHGRARSLRQHEPPRRAAPRLGRALRPLFIFHPRPVLPLSRALAPLRAAPRRAAPRLGRARGVRRSRRRSSPPAPSAKALTAPWWPLETRLAPQNTDDK